MAFARKQTQSDTATNQPETKGNSLTPMEKPAKENFSQKNACAEGDDLES
jgi:hypothetical protein